MRVLTAPSDYDEWDAYAVANGWSDGLPLVPPTPDRVERALRHVGWAPDRVVGEIPPIGGPATVAKIAVNAVMAGCPARLLPLVVTAVDAVCDPRFGLAAVQATTNPATFGLVVNGPARLELGIGVAGNCLGATVPANVALGRAVRLVLRNLGGGLGSDAATQGQPAKVGLAWGENEEASPWQPLHVERGFAPRSSTVTAVPMSGTQNLLETSSDADELIRSLGCSVSSPTGNDYMFASEPWLVMCPEHAAVLAEAGYSKQAAKAAFWAAATVPVADFTASTTRYRLARTWPSRYQKPDFAVPVSRTADDVRFVVAGGAGCHSTFVPTIGVSTSVTKEVSCWSST